MFDFVKRLFGEGYIYADFVCEDGFTGLAKAPYVGDPATFDKNEYTEHLKSEIWFKYGRRITEISNIRIL